MVTRETSASRLFRAVHMGANQLFASGPGCWNVTSDGVVMDGRNQPVEPARAISGQVADELAEIMNTLRPSNGISDAALDALLSAMLLRFAEKLGYAEPKDWIINHRVMANGTMLVAVADPDVLQQLRERFVRVKNDHFEKPNELGIRYVAVRN